MTEVILDPQVSPASVVSPIPIHLLTPDEAARFIETATAAVRAAAALAKFAGKAGEIVTAPAPDGTVERVLVGLGEQGAGAMGLRALPARLAEGDYRIETPISAGLSG